MGSSSYASYFVLSVFLCFVIFKVLQFLKRFRRWHILYDCFPGVKEKHPLWGTVHLYPGPNEAGLAYSLNLCSQFPKLYRLWMGLFLPVIVLHHPDTLRAVLKSSDVPKPRSLGSVYNMGLKWLGESLILTNGQRWERNRRLVTPAFHFDILKPYVNVYNSAVDILVNKINECTESGESFELFSVIGQCSLDIVLQCAFTYKSDCQIQGENHPYLKAVDELCHLWMKRALKPYLYLDCIYFWTKDGRKFLRNCAYVHKVANDIIEKRKKIIEEEGLPEKVSGHKYLDFIDILLTARDEDGKGLSTLEIRNDVNTILFAGHDTTTSSMCWTLYSLAANPDKQRRVQEEIDDILSWRQTDHIEWSDLQNLKYLTLCIKESLRLHCPVPFIQRQTVKDLEVDNWTIPAGSCLDISIYNLHHNPEVWDDPFEFIPERFNADNIDLKDPFAYIPFSAGPRNCIGQHFAMNEQKVVLARLLHKYRFELVPGHEVKKVIEVIMNAENGIRVTAHPRL